MSDTRRSEFTWQEMIFLHKNCIGLRAVANETAASDAKENGGYGDAVSLAAFGCRDTTRSELNGKYDFLANEKIMDQHYPEDKANLQSEFLSGIYDHVEAAVFTHGARAFILVTMNDTLHAYDFETYPLGKCGDQKFTSAQVKKIITLPTTTVNPYAHVIDGIKDFCQAQMQAQPKFTQENLKHTLLAPAQKSQEVKANPSAEFTWRCVIL